MRNPAFRFQIAIIVFAAAIGSHVLNLVSAWAGFHGGSADFPTLIAATQHIWGGGGYGALHIGAPGAFLTGAQTEPYPPTFFLLLGPVAVLGENLRDVLWIMVQEAALVVTVFAVYAGIGRPSQSEGLLAAAMILIFLPIRESVFEGQVAVVLTMLMVLAWLAPQRAHPLLGGVSLAVAIALKLTPALLLPYFIWRRSYRLVAAAVLGTGALALATVALGWLPRWREYIPLSQMLGRGTAFIANQSINGALLRILRPEFNGLPIPALPAWMTALWAGLAIGLVVLLALILRRSKLPQPELRWTEFALVLLVVPMVQPFAWFHHHAAAVVAIIMGIRLAARGFLSAGPAAGLFLAYVVVTFVAYPVHRLARNLTGDQLQQNLGLRLATSTMVLAVLVAIYCLSRARSSVGRPGEAVAAS